MPPPLRTFSTAWREFPPYDGLGMPRSSSTDWAFEGYAEGDRWLGPMQDMRPVFEAAAAHVPNRAIFRTTPQGAGVVYPAVDEGFNSPSVPPHVVHRSVVYSEQAHASAFPDMVREGFVRPPYPSDLVREDNPPPWGPDDSILFDTWWEIEGVQGKSPWPPPIQSVQMWLDIGGATMGLDYPFDQPNRTASTTAKVRWLNPARCRWEQDPKGGGGLVPQTTQPPFPIPDGTLIRSIFVPAEPDNVTVVSSPSTHAVPLGGGFYGYEVTTDTVEGQLAAFDYSLVNVTVSWRWQITWPRWRYFWQVRRGVPPLRQRQRGDSLVHGGGRQFVRNAPGSTQGSVRQLWQGTFL